MFFVYYLLAESSGELLYVGRSNQPRVRQTSFHRRTGVRTVMGVCQRFSEFSKACKAELVAIQKHRPPFNKVLVSSAGSLGLSIPQSTFTKEKRSRSLAGKPKTEEHKNNMSKAHLGKVFTEEHRKKISHAKQNISNETRAKIGAASKGRHWSEASKEKLRQTRRLKNMKGGTQN